MKHLELFETYSQYHRHYSKLDDLLDELLPLLDEFGIIEGNDLQKSGGIVPPNWKFVYLMDCLYEVTNDGIIISSINSFKAGQEMLKKLADLAPKIERAIGCEIGIQTSDSISTTEDILRYKRRNNEWGKDVHPYIYIHLNPGSNFKEIEYRH